MKDCKTTKCLKRECIQIDQQDFQQDSQLFINDRVFINIYCFRFIYIMSNIDNDLFFEFVENVDVIFWITYYKQQIEKNYKKIIKFEIRNVERLKFTIFIFSFVFVWKFFTMKIINVTFDQYQEKNYKKWKKYCKQMKNQFTQNNVNHMI